MELTIVIIMCLHNLILSNGRMEIATINDILSNGHVT